MARMQLQVFHDGDVSERFAEMLPYFAADCQEAARVSLEDYPSYCERHGFEQDSASSMDRYTHYKALGKRALGPWMPYARV